MKNDTVMRLDKAICTLTGMIRTDAKKAIFRREVTVDGEVISSPDYHCDFCGKTLSVCGEEFVFRSKIYIMMNKPKDCVCTSADDERSVLLRLPDKLYRRDLFTVGRLDMDTTGLLLITNDGDYAHKVISPKNHVPKVYSAVLAEPICDGQIDKLMCGVTMNDGDFAKALEIKPSADRKSIDIAVDCGKYHMVKRMIAAAGNSVMNLHRKAIGALTLPNDLAIGGAIILQNGEENKAFVQKL